jgi:hypothetical protein
LKNIQSFELILGYHVQENERGMSTTCYLHDTTYGAKTLAPEVIHDAFGGFKVTR